MLCGPTSSPTTERFTDARLLLDRVLREDPQNVLAHETMGFLGISRRASGRIAQVYEQAVKTRFAELPAHYYFAAIP